MIRLNALARISGVGPNTLLGLHMKDVEILEVIWHSMEEGVRKLREVAVLEEIYCLRLEKLPFDCFSLEDSDDTCQ